MNNTILVKFRTQKLIENFSLVFIKYSYYKIIAKYFISDGLYGIDLEIISKRNFTDIYKIVSIIHELIFLNFGYFLEIFEYLENDTIIDVSKYCNLDYINSFNSHFKGYYTDINNLITNLSIRKYKMLKNKFLNGLNSFFYLESKKYKDILVDHRFCILSQICEGLIESSRLENVVSARVNNISRRRYINFKDRIEYYISELDYYNKKYMISIYKALRIKRTTFLEQMKNSRHSLSHYVKKKNKLRTTNYLFAYILLSNLFRIVILKELSVILNEDYIKESLYIIRDYIYTINFNNNDFDKMKSSLYKLFGINKI